MAARTAFQRAGDLGGLRRGLPRKESHGGALFAVAACTACFVAIFWFLRSVPAPRPAAPSPPANPWARIVDPIPLYDLPAPDFNAEKRSYEAWRARTGPGRRDLIAFGAFGEDAPYLELTILEPRPATTSQPFFAAVARQSAFSGLAVLRSAVPDGYATRFGMLSVSDVIVAKDGSSRACLGFRVGSEVRMTGLACGSSARPMTRVDLICALDRLDLVGGAEGSSVTLFFERSELARGEGCPSDRFSPAGRRESWLDSGSSLPSFEGAPTAQRVAARHVHDVKL